MCSGCDGHNTPTHSPQHPAPPAIAVNSRFAAESLADRTVFGGSYLPIVYEMQDVFLQTSEYSALADKIAYLINNPAMAKEMGAAGRKRAKENFSIEKNVKLTEKVYLEILKK